jgi:hypothetical protein
VVGRLLAVQAQDLRAARLAIRARSSGLTATDVDRALTADRSLVVGWLGRGTLHLVRAEDYWWLHALTAPPRFSGNARRLSHLGVSAEMAERALILVRRHLASEGPLSRAELAERLAAGGVPTGGQTMPHLLFLAALRGIILLGPIRAPRQAFALAADWIGPTPLINREVALAELARRYLGGHGPATAADLAAWAGLPLGAARQGLRLIGSELAELADGLLDLDRRPAAAAPPEPRLIAAFDPYLLGWRDRSFLGRPADLAAVYPGGGMVRAAALAAGAIAGTWSVGGKFRFLYRMSGSVVRAFKAELADVVRFEGA